MTSFLSHLLSILSISNLINLRSKFSSFVFNNQFTQDVFVSNFRILFNVKTTKRFSLDHGIRQRMFVLINEKFVAKLVLRPYM